MQDVATREQQILLDTRGYVSVSDGNFGNKPSVSPPGVGLAQPDTTTGKYTYSVVAVNTATPPTYTITATAINGQDSDASLHLLKLDEQGNRTTWNSGGTQTGTW